MNDSSRVEQASSAEVARLQLGQQELIERIKRIVRTDGTAEPLPGLSLHRSSAPGEPLHSVYDPVFCVIAQGSKEIFLGRERYLYDAAHYLIVTANLPVVAHVLEASPERPYLSLRLKLDPLLVSSVMIEAGRTVLSQRASVRAINVSPLDSELLDAVVRLVRVADSPDEAHFLAPLITREIIYRLLTGEQCDRLRYIVVQDGVAHHIARAIEWFRKEIDQPPSIERVAQELGMSVSSFHHHFKAVTAMSPLQFQKRLRLQEARRLMLGEHLDAASAAYRVGYDDASHFSREYKSLFGAPPMRDMQQLRDGIRQLAS
ncbi:MAG TPA: AraC family transcriptional regulator CmrA [Chloroflexi bacterium]|nr:AraC family transcriptional regulator CmrA [Chloroflexota bacterium]HHW85743.1 AraC family transcriptional regulator [Chloroflexota bacterium]